MAKVTKIIQTWQNGKSKLQVEGMVGLPSGKLVLDELITNDILMIRNGWKLIDIAVQIKEPLYAQAEEVNQD